MKANKFTANISSTQQFGVLIEYSHSGGSIGLEAWTVSLSQLSWSPPPSVGGHRCLAQGFKLFNCPIVLEHVPVNEIVTMTKVAACQQLQLENG